MGSLEIHNNNCRQAPLTCSGHTRPVVHLAFSEITETGYYLISACKDGKPMLRHGDTGDWIGTFIGHKGAVWGVALNKDATRAATGAADFTAKIWDAITGNELISFQHNHIVRSVNFSADEQQLITSSEKFLRIFDLTRTEKAPEIFPIHTGSVRSAIFFNNDKRIASCSEDRTLRLLDRSCGRETHRVIFNSCPNSLEMSKDETILTTTNGNSVTFWDSRDLTKLKEITVPTKVYSASLDPNKSMFVCGGDDLKMYKYNFYNGAEIDSFKGHFGPIHCCRFSPDGELYASGSEDGTVRLWQTTVGKTYGLWRSIDDVLLGDYDDDDIPNDELLAKLMAESCDEFNTSVL